MSKHLVVEAHLLIDDSIHNPFRVGAATAKAVKKFLEDTYQQANGTRQVSVPIVSYRLSDIADTNE